MQRHLRLAIALVAVSSLSALTALTGCGSNERTSSIGKLTGTASSGASVYATKCLSCHGSDGRSGSAREDIAHEARDDSDEAIDKILGGGGGMPSFSNLSDQDIADLVAYLKTL